MNVAPSYSQSADAVAFFKDVNAKVPAPPPDLIVSLLKDGFEKTHQTNPQVCVPASVTISDIKPATADAAVWAAIRNGQARNGWTMRADMAGCALNFANYLVLRLKDDGSGRAAFREIAFSRGSTHVGFSISKDAMKAALGAMVAGLRKDKIDVTPGGCIAHIVVGVREVVADANSGPDIYGVRFGGEWAEKWHFQACGHDVSVPIRFRADGQGGAFFDVAANDAVVTDAR